MALRPEVYNLFVQVIPLVTRELRFEPQTDLFRSVLPTFVSLMKQEGPRTMAFLLLAARFGLLPQMAAVRLRPLQRVWAGLRGRELLLRHSTGCRSLISLPPLS